MTSTLYEQRLTQGKKIHPPSMIFFTISPDPMTTSLATNTMPMSFFFEGEAERTRAVQVLNHGRMPAEVPHFEDLDVGFGRSLLRLSTSTKVQPEAKPKMWEQLWENTRPSENSNTNQCS